MSAPTLRVPLGPALIAARAAGALSRRLGRGGGTSLPGTVFLRLCPDGIARLGRRLDGPTALVSATNGKTTTARLIASCLREAGRPVVSNPSGANLVTGVSTALLEAGIGSRDPRGALFEVDEAALPAVARQLPPRVLVLMNLFRDQLDRHGELESIADRWRDMIGALPAASRCVLNADDPAIAAFVDDHRAPLLFGIDDPRVRLEGLPHAADSIRCRRCAGPLTYRRVTLGHQGDWACAACGAHRPRPDVRATEVGLRGVDGLSLTIETPRGPVVADIPLPGVHNAYNATAAVAAAIALGLEPEQIARGLARADAAFGRAERLTVDGRDLVLLLAKNPAGANETVRTVLLDERPAHLLMSLNDRAADGRDTSWIWDVDYEPLWERCAALTLTGDRAHELALRLHYSGIVAPAARIEPDPRRALDSALAGTPPGGTLYVLPTYTAMLELRRLLAERGVVKDFWHER
ncbi:MAG TPA: MurT ligase domain-containing protein [Miltoncostaeaceae bacterium]|nr:MurT ligase domain-containing protein [Miltoncostaeaceae bacterium]